MWVNEFIHMYLFELMLSNILDIDECAMELDECSDNAACTDTDGGYECTCNAGFTGDGFTCTSKSLIPILFLCIRSAVILETYPLTYNEFIHMYFLKLMLSNILDIDECALGIDGCSDNAVY